MFKPGEVIKFDWWSAYRAPCVQKSKNGCTEWFELVPGDTGRIISVYPNDDEHGYHATVRFNRIDRNVKMRMSMLSPTKIK